MASRSPELAPLLIAPTQQKEKGYTAQKQKNRCKADPENDVKSHTVSFLVHPSAPASEKCTGSRRPPFSL